MNGEINYCVNCGINLKNTKTNWKLDALKIAVNKSFGTNISIECVEGVNIIFIECGSCGCCFNILLNRQSKDFNNA